MTYWEHLDALLKQAEEAGFDVQHPDNEGIILEVAKPLPRQFPIEYLIPASKGMYGMIILEVSKQDDLFISDFQREDLRNWNSRTIIDDLCTITSLDVVTMKHRPSRDTLARIEIQSDGRFISPSLALMALPTYLEAFRYILASLK
jgi:hypothetical protein